jgi:hypothetical protein
MDARQPEVWQLAAASAPSGIDWVITNPPFNGAYPILRQALDCAVVGVTFFLRISFMEPTKERGPFLAKCPPDWMLSLPRFSWDGDGNTDSNNCCWFGWYKNCHCMKRGDLEVVHKPGQIPGCTSPYRALPYGIEVFNEEAPKEQGRFDL